MGFLAGALQGTRNSLARQLAMNREDAANAEDTRRWNLNYGLNRRTTESNLATAAQLRSLRGTAADQQAEMHPLTLEGMRQNLAIGKQNMQFRAQEQPYRLRSMDLANQLQGQTYDQRSQMFPGQLAQQNLTTEQMRANNAFMSKYRPGVLDAQRITNERNQQIIDQSEQLFGRQLTAADLANMQNYQTYEQRGQMFPFQLGAAHLANQNAEQAYHHNYAMSPLQQQLTQAQINWYNQRTAAEGQTDYSKLYSALHDDAYKHGKSLMGRLPDFKKAGWFGGKLKQGGLAFAVQDFARTAAMQYRGVPMSPFEINRLATQYLLGMQQSDEYPDIIKRIDKSQYKTQNNFELALHRSLALGIMDGLGYSTNQALPDEMRRSLEEGVQGGGVGFAPAATYLKYGAGTLVGAQVLGSVPGLRRYTGWMRPFTRGGFGWAQRGAKSVSNIPSAWKMNREIRSQTMQGLKTLRDQAAAEMSQYGSVSAPTQQALNRAIQSAKELGL